MKKILFALVILNLVLMPVSFADEPAATNSAQKTPASPSSVGDPMNTNFMFDLRPITNEGLNTEELAQGGINYLFNRAIALMAGTIGTASVLAIVYGGFKIITAMGHEDEMAAGKSMINKAVKALVFVLGAYVIVTAVQLLVKSLYG